MSDPDKLKSHFEHLKWKFNLIDKNKDGFLTQDEVRHTFSNSQIPETKSLMDNIFKELDLNNDQKISVHEFLEYIKVQHPKLTSFFEKLDTTNKGKVEISIINKGLKDHGWIIKDGDNLELLKLVDTDKDGMISYLEFMEFFYLIPVEFISKYFEEFFSHPFNQLNQHKIPQYTDIQYGVITMMISCFVSSIVAKTLTAPFDRVKTIMQANRTKISSIFLFKNIIKEEGFKGFFKGNGANILKIFNEIYVKLSLFDLLKFRVFKYKENPQQFQVKEKLISGAISGVCSQAFVFPIEVIKTRLSVSRNQKYKGIFDCIKQIHKNEGSRAFYKGLSSSVLAILPYSSIELAVFFELKQYYKKNQLKEPGAAILFWSGCIANACGQIVSYPLSLMATRLQNDGTGPDRHYTNLKDCINKIRAAEGFRGFYKGMHIGLLKSIPTSALGFTVFETSRKFLSDKGFNY